MRALKTRRHGATAAAAAAARSRERESGHSTSHRTERGLRRRMAIHLVGEGGGEGRRWGARVMGGGEGPPLESELVELQVLPEVHEHNAAALSPRERAAGRRRQPESSTPLAPAPRARRRVAAGLVGLITAAGSVLARANPAGGGGGGATRARRGVAEVWEERGMA